MQRKHIVVPCMHAGLGQRLLRTPSSAKSLGEGEDPSVHPAS